MIAALQIQKDALDDVRTVLRAAKARHGEVEVGFIHFEQLAKPGVISTFQIIQGQNVSPVSFEASEGALLATLHGLDEGLSWSGICHAHPSSGPFGHSAVDEKHIEQEILPLIARGRTPQSYVRRQLSAKFDPETGAQRYYLDRLERASVLVHGAGAVTLELGVSEGSATSVVVLAPDYASRIYALRQKHRFTPMLTSNETLFHEQWTEEPIVEIVPSDGTRTPLSEEQAMDLVQKYVWATPRVTYSIPRPTRPFRASAWQRVRQDLKNLARSVVELGKEEVATRMRGKW
jgi:hypothetical protein